MKVCLVGIYIKVSVFVSVTSCQRAVAALNIDDKKKSVRLEGHEGLITINRGCKMDTLSLFTASYIPLRGSGVRVKGQRLHVPSSENHIPAFTHTLMTVVYWFTVKSPVFCALWVGLCFIWWRRRQEGAAGETFIPDDAVSHTTLLILGRKMSFLESVAGENGVIFTRLG